MNLIIETTFKSDKQKKDIESFTVFCDVNTIQKIIDSKGIEAANTAIDSFVAKYTEDFKKKLSNALRKV